ncbi:MAG: MarR family transcriptional regulator [Syntrophomonadaceae bacterium]
MENFTEFVCFKIGAVARKIQNYYNGVYRQYGITLGQSFILFALQQKEGLSIGNLAEKLLLDNSALTGLVDRMEKEELVLRRVDCQDRRVFLIYLTDKGRELAVTLYPIAREFNQRLNDELSNEQREAFSILMNQVL